MPLRIAPLLVAATLSTSLHAQTPSSTRDLLLAANQFDRTLSLIDPVSGKQIAVIPEDRVTGHEIATSPDGRTVFIPIYGDSGVGKPGTDGHEILAVDLASRRVAHVIDLGHPVRPHRVLYNPADRLLYVSAELDNAVDIVDPNSFKLVGSIPTGEPQSHMFVLSPDGRRAFTANVSTGTVSVLDLKARTLLGIIPVTKGVQRIAISNDGALVFTFDVDKPDLDVIDTASRTLKARVPLPSNGYGAVATTDGRSLLIVLPKLDQVVVVDLASMTISRTIPTAVGPQSIFLRPDGRVAYVGCLRSKTITAIDTATFTVLQQIAAGDGVDGLAWAGASR